MGQESQSTDSLFDIFYADRDRLLSYLAQIDPNGTITSIKTTLSDSESKRSNGELDVKLVKGSISSTEKKSDGMEKTFDPAMVLPFTIMDVLQERGFIGKDITHSGLGSLVLFSGSMRIKELSHSPLMWPIVEKNLPFEAFAPNLNGLTKAQKSAIMKTSLSLTEVKKMLESFFRGITHPIQVEVKNTAHKVWGTFNEKSLCASISDFGFKFSSIIPGTWHMLCILDCQPGDVNQEEKDLWAEDSGSLSDGLSNAVSAFKNMFGRPENAYGVTPLIVFRKTPIAKVGNS